VFCRQQLYKEADKDENVNGRRGYLPRSSIHNSQSISKNSPNAIALPVYDSTLSMAAFRDDAVRTNSIVNRQKQLQSLRRMEERLQIHKAQSKIMKKTENTLGIYILDISNILCEECSASWIPLKHSNETGPDERILYSLVLGREELIVFGGIRKKQVTIQGETDIDDSQVYNDLHFINPPKKYII
jgi:F-box protein 42